MRRTRSRKKSSTVTIVFIAVQLFLVFFYIHHQSALIKLSYQRQKHENHKLTLAKKKRELKHTLHASNSLSRIKNYAVQANMKKITLDQIKTVPDERPTA